MTSFQLNTCTAYYQNGIRQPWYMQLVIVVPLVIGLIVMFRNIKRTIYDTLSLPVFLAAVGIFVLRAENYAKSLAEETQASDGAKEEYLKQIAYAHVIVGGLLVLLLILQGLAERNVKILGKKNL